MALALGLFVTGCSPSPLEPDCVITPRSNIRQGGEWEHAQPDISIVAHRGFGWRHPENTLRAIEGAFAMGAAAVEVDVRFERDGIPVLMHDPTVDRTTNGQGWVHEMTLSDLEALDACSWFDPASGPCQVPTLRSALAASSKGFLVIDVKRAVSPCEMHAIVSDIEATASAHRAAVIASDIGVLQFALERMDGLRVGYLTTRAVVPSSIRPLGITAIFMPLDSVLAQPSYAAAVASAGLTLGSWTAHNTTHIKRARSAGIRWLLSELLSDDVP